MPYPKVIITRDEKEIAVWAEHILGHKLYRDDGLVQHACRTGEYKIHMIAIIPNVAWGIIHDYGLKRDSKRWSFFTRPECRRQGYATYIWGMMLSDENKLLRKRIEELERSGTGAIDDRR